jgi:hypothetical protein
MLKNIISNTALWVEVRAIFASPTCCGDPVGIAN